jgi:hypothetical protein
MAKKKRKHIAHRVFTQKLIHKEPAEKSGHHPALVGQ